MGGKGRGGGTKKKISVFLVKSLVWQRKKIISNITFGFTVIFTFIHSKCSMQASNFSLGREWGGGGGGRRKEGVRDGGRNKKR